MVRIPKAEAMEERKPIKKKARTPSVRVSKIKIKKTPQQKDSGGTPIRVTTGRTTHKISVAISDNTKRKLVATPTHIKKETQLTLLSPFRFSMPQEMMVSSVARYAGVFFVLAGAFFSLANLHAVSGTYAAFSGTNQFAQLIGTVFTETSTVLSGTTPTSSTDTSGSIDTTPDVHITTVLTDLLSIPIYITVPDALGVKLMVEDTKTDKLLTLGSANQIDKTTWSYNWNTKEYPSGKYRLRAVIKNEYGTYYHEDSGNISLETYVSETTGGETSPIVNTTTESVSILNPEVDSSQIENVSTMSVSFDIDADTPIDGKETFTIRAEGASEVKVYARNTNTRILSYIGYAQKNDMATWQIDWNSMNVLDGTYTLQAKARFGDIFIDSLPVTIEVDNNEENQTIATDDTSTTTDKASLEDTATALTPTIELTLSKSNPISGSVDIEVQTSEVFWVELYARQKNSLTSFFLGLAQKESDTNWVYSWTTKETPNGEYDVYARVKTNYGFTEGNRLEVKILNDVPADFTKEQETTIDTLLNINNALIKTTENSDTAVAAPNTLDAPYALVQPRYVKTVDSFVDAVAVEEEMKEEIDVLLTEFRSRLNAKINELARAIRTNDTDALRNVQNDIEALQNEIKDRIPNGVDRKEIIDDIHEYIAEIVLELESITTQNEAILKERIGDAIVTDSDKDGISDYDEVSLYKTNPFVADTDGDSYIDSVEITLGYNPLDSSSEALVTYESPQETGVVREDLLMVDSITALPPISESVDAERDIPQRAVISGTGLPNSFVTLYIFSTPIVVTVKTDAEGGWSYVFDKELEDGEHEMYVGITDNAGRVVAKSNPFTFVKTAEAFTGGAASIEALESDDADPSLIGGSALLLIASIAIAALGLVLILLGIHVKERRFVEPITQNA